MPTIRPTSPASPRRPSSPAVSLLTGLALLPAGAFSRILGGADLLATLLLTEAWVALVVAAAWRAGRLPPLPEWRLRDVGYGVASGFLLLPLGVVGYAASALLAGTPPPVPPPPGWAGRLALGAGMLLAAPVEELAFRHLVLSGPSRSLGRWPAILLVAVLFAVYHGSPVFWPPNLLLGVGLGWIALRRASVWAAVAAHAAYNGLGWLLFVGFAGG